METELKTAVGEKAAVDDGKRSYSEHKIMRRLGLALTILPFAVILLVCIFSLSNIGRYLAHVWGQADDAKIVRNANFEKLGLYSSDCTDCRSSEDAIYDKILLILTRINALAGYGGIVVLVPLGAIMIMCSRRKLRSGIPFDERSGKGRRSEIPPELGGWNWGTAALSFWWGSYNGVRSAFLFFVPFVGLFWWAVMGLRGNAWSWKRNKWRSVDEFKQAQAKWGARPVVLVILVFNVVFAFAFQALFFKLLSLYLSSR